MPIVNENRLKGNYGAAVVMERLSSHCLVRPVAVDTDVGVDLYCETVAEDGRPFLHFWVQVKAGKTCIVTEDGFQASMSFDREHVQYWLEQPVPVFAALVPTPTWPTREAPSVYIVDFTHQALFGDLSSLESDASISLESTLMLRPNQLDDVRTFLGTLVPLATARQDWKKGIAPCVPTATPQYLRGNPLMPVRRYFPLIELQVRHTAAQSVISACHDLRAESEQEARFRRLMVKVVEQFEDLNHWENMLACGFSYHLDGRFKDAAVQYEESRKCVQRDQDPRVRDSSDFHEKVRRLDGLVELARAGEPLKPRGMLLFATGSPDPLPQV